MGQGACTGNLEGDICKLGNCVEKLDGRASNSASPSDIWRLTLKDGATYKGIPVKRAWLKVFISNAKAPMRSTVGLMYELRVYRKVVSPLIEQRVCPNFVRYLSSTTGCGFADVQGILSSQGIGELNFKRSLCYMTQRASKPIVPAGQPPIGPRKRPSINDHVTLTELTAIKRMKIDFNRLEFGMLLTQDRKVITLAEWFTRPRNNSDFACMMLQVTAALRAMELSLFAHNDLHLRNILVEQNDAATNVRYIMDGHEFGICVRLRILIFDFDRAYVRQLGENKLVNDHACYQREFEPGRDLGSVLSLLFKRCSYKQAAMLEEAFHVQAGDYMKKLKGGVKPSFKQAANSEKTFRLEETGARVNHRNGYVKFDCAPAVPHRASMVSAMRYFYKHILHKCSGAEADYTYICDRSMFHSDGRLRSRGAVSPL
jgi:hypothetical protein